jgi:hypothetical protein
MTPPPDPADDPPPPRVLSAAFWVMMALGALCILAGALVATEGPRLFPAHAKAHVPRQGPGALGARPKAR